MMTQSKPVRQEKDCDDLFEQRLVQQVAEQGFQTVHQPNSCYTVGLWHSHRHPELIIFGLPTERAHHLLGEAARQVIEGQHWNLNQDITTLTQEHPLRLQPVAECHHRDYLSYNRWFYRGDGFRAWQLVWPDPDGHFPGHPEFLPHLQSVQPDLRVEI
jgi:hypothetical protein